MVRQGALKLLLIPNDLPLFFAAHRAPSYPDEARRKAEPEFIHLNTALTRYKKMPKFMGKYQDREDRDEDNKCKHSEKT